MSEQTGTVADIEARWQGFAACPPVDRRASLADAVARHVRPGQTLYFGGSMARPNAAMFEVARQFWGKAPGFTLVAPAVANQHAPLIRGGLVSTVVSSIHAMTFPTPAPHPLYVETAKSGDVVYENWSLLTLTKRLMAAAMGLPFLPTRSLSGSDMLADLSAGGGAASVADPFGAGETAVVAPLVPDVCFVHAPAADIEGNVVICPPLYDGPWPALAARAVIVTVERIVSSEQLRRWADLVRIPAERVSAICVVPLGGHPNSLPGHAAAGIDGYPDDYDFLEDLRAAGRTPEGLDAWAQEWIVGCADHDAYLAKLGLARTHALRGRAHPDGWMQEWAELGPVSARGAATINERHAILASRALLRRFRSGDIDCILAGLGISSLAAWMGAMRTLEEGRRIPLMVEAGMYGYLPSPADPFLFNFRNMARGSMLADTVSTLGVMTGGAGNRAIGVLGAAQVDSRGNLNTTRLPGMLLTGSGGANDIGSGASEVLVTIQHSKRRLVEAVDFVTTPGRAVKTIVTPACVLERRGERYALTAVAADGDRSIVELVDAARAGIGFAVDVANEVALEPPPSEDEIAFARQLDPKGLFLG